MDDEFDAHNDLVEIQQYRRVCRRKRYYQSKLLKYRRELVALRIHGATIKDLVLWLRKKHRILTAGSTVWRYLSKLPELR